jgi:hypothetical protein
VPPDEIGQPKTKEGFEVQERGAWCSAGWPSPCRSSPGWCENGDIAGKVLIVVGLAALGYIVYEMVRVTKIERERLQVILIMAFFSMLFWAFFEQAGSSISLFTDRNVDRVTEARAGSPRARRRRVHRHRAQPGAGGLPSSTARVFTLDRLDTAARRRARAAHETEVRAARRHRATTWAWPSAAPRCPPACSRRPTPSSS